MEDLDSPDCPIDLVVEQMRLKREGKYGIADRIWDQAEQWDQLLGSYAAIVDVPGPMFVVELARAYPEAKVILTKRDSPESWQESYRNNIYERFVRLRESFSYRTMHMLRRLFNKESNRIKAQRALERKDGDAIKEPQIWWYTEHLTYVRNYIPPERLLEYNVKEGWGPLCEFLGKDVPDAPFPRSNAKKVFQQRTTEVIQQAEQEVKQLLQLAAGSTGALFLAYFLFR